MDSGLSKAIRKATLYTHNAVSADIGRVAPFIVSPPCLGWGAVSAYNRVSQRLAESYFSVIFELPDRQDFDGSFSVIKKGVQMNKTITKSFGFSVIIGLVPMYASGVPEFSSVFDIYEYCHRYIPDDTYGCITICEDCMASGRTDARTNAQGQVIGFYATYPDLNPEWECSCPSTKVTKYGCNAGTWYSGYIESNTICQPCPANATCPGGLNYADFTCNNGYVKNSSGTGCQKCTCTNCPTIDTGWVINSSNKTQETWTTQSCNSVSGGSCKCEKSIKTRCATGYYGISSNCTACPTLSGGKTISTPGDNSYKDKCFVALNSVFADATGNWQYTAACYYACDSGEDGCTPQVESTTTTTEA